MSKFDSRARVLPAPDTVTAQGGAGFSRSDKLELVLLGASNTVSEDTFYESGAERDKRFESLIRKVTIGDPEWVREFVVWLRQEANMRSASIVAAAEYVAAGGPNGRSVVAAALQRPDEPGEMLAYWRSAHGRAIPKPIKRGVADAARRLYTERNMLRYDGQSKNWRWGDVIELTHPKADTDWQSDLFRFAIERRQGRGSEIPMSLATMRADSRLMQIPESERRSHLGSAIEAGWSWERLGGWLPGGMDAEAWEAVIPNMGLMALTRNLRNFDDAGISDAAVAEVQRRLKDPDEVRKSRQFPLRFLLAWKNVPSLRWGDALETALNHSLENVPSLPGRTLVLIDVSGSMHGPMLSGHRGTGVSPSRWEAAAVFGLAFAQRANAADVFLFDTNTYQARFNSGGSILRTVEKLATVGGGGTDTLGSLVRTFNGHDRVVIVTDEQTGPSTRRYSYGYGYNAGVETTWEQAKARVKVPVITFNIAGYRAGHTPVQDNWITIGGLNDAAFTLTASIGSDRPWSHVTR